MNTNFFYHGESPPCDQSATPLQLVPSHHTTHRQCSTSVRNTTEGKRRLPREVRVDLNELERFPFDLENSLKGERERVN